MDQNFETNQTSLKRVCLLYNRVNPIDKCMVYSLFLQRNKQRN